MRLSVVSSSLLWLLIRVKPKGFRYNFSCWSWGGGFLGRAIVPPMLPAIRSIFPLTNEVSDAAAIRVSTEMDLPTAQVAGEFLIAIFQRSGLADVGKQSKLVSLLEGS